VNSDCPQHYALNASGKEVINLGSISASGPILSFAGQSRNGKFPPIPVCQGAYGCVSFKGAATPLGATVMGA
jgi:hypothetical protein